ncbi:MAG: NUDIX hydrolase [Gammaproteobacteria bacterium]|nr:NUDIX hydrolase [Gammaproteobacteria bacterium]
MTDVPTGTGVRAVYRGRVIDVDVETVRLPAGRDVALEIVRHPGGAAAVACAQDGRVCLLRQYRHAVGEWLWEIPAGRIDPGETPLATAQRELAEESGVRGTRWRSLGTTVPAPGFCAEIIHLFYTEDLQHVAPRPEADELFEVHWIALGEAVARVFDGRISDAKTALALLRAAHLRGVLAAGTGAAGTPGF